LSALASFYLRSHCQSAVLDSMMVSPRP
jgi:hypothetical protein